MTKQVPGKARASTARDLRQLRGRRLMRRLLLGVVLPTLLASVYYGVIVTPRYESVSAFTIHSADGGASSSLEFLIASVPNSATRDVLLVQEYARSREMLRHLVDEHGFLEHYTDAAHDPFSRLPADASFEEQYEYFLEQVALEHDSQSGLLTLRVKAFDAATAHGLAQAILAASETKVNEMTAKARQDRIALAQREVERAEERLGRARQAVAEAQREGAEINPAESAAALLGVRSRIEGELATARAELSALRATLQPGTPRLVEARQRVAGLARQLERQNTRLAGNDDSTLRESITRFEPLVAEKEFAQRAYASALTSLEVARVEADRQHRYLVTIAQPSEPDEPTHPRFWHSLLTVLVLSFAGLGIGTLLLASIREHANV